MKKKPVKKAAAAKPKPKPETKLRTKPKPKTKRRLKPTSKPTSMRKTQTKARVQTPAPDGASRRIDETIASLADWRGTTLDRVRTLIHEALPDVVEEWKWDVPVWSRGGILCTGETYTSVVKLTFPKGASLPDPVRLFNSSLGGNTRRAIDLHEGEEIDAGAFRALVRAAADANSRR